MQVKLLDVNNLSLSFKSKLGDQQVLKNISFSLNKAKTLGIVGESGSGKSLTALSILKLLPQNANVKSGDVLYYANDKEINIIQLSEKELLNVRGRNISMIFQEPMTSLDPMFTIGDEIAEVIRLHQGLKKDEARKKAIESLKTVGMPDPEKRINEYP
ncbi:MAG: ABC transporter ATP-binding protein, partial [Bacteroidales bacterium]|nr:ABC transporter ATP-binding protein [Bacteroidales bacterium]